MDNKKVLNRTFEHLEFRKDRDIQDWVKTYKELSEDEQFDIIKHLEVEQALFIKHSMANMDKPIDLYKLGSLYYKENRVRFYELKRENPDKSINEVVDMLKQEVKDKNK